MDISDVINRQPIPQPWAEGETIPWHDPGFSARMLKEHLSQDHDAASRRFDKIDLNVDWIHQTLLGSRPARVLDLCCGPGFYSSRLARLGHVCRGIDFSRASIAYAGSVAQQEDLACTYTHEDVREADYGQGYGLAMLIFGEFNVFRPTDAKKIVQKTFSALSDEGILLLEPSAFQSVETQGRQESGWYSSPNGLFSDQPHLCLTEHTRDTDRCVATTRYIIVHVDGNVTWCAGSYQAHTDQEYRSLLAACGFSIVKFRPSLTGQFDETQKDYFALVARKAPGGT